MRNPANVARWFLFAFVTAHILLLPASVYGTSVVALIDQRNHRVVIAADCRVNREVDSLSECKIIEEPGCVVAIAGLYQENTTEFNLRQLADAACRYAGDLREKADAFLRLSKIPYERAVRHIREEEPGEFARRIQNKPTELIFAGIQGGHVALMVRGLVADSTGKIRTERFESVAPSYARAGYFLGLNGHIRAHVKAHPEWVNEDYVELAREFVEIEMKAHPDLAGPPISELEIDSYGYVHWLDKGACASREFGRSTR